MCIDTIAAISTPLGQGGIGIVRMSGPDAIGISSRLVRHDAEAQPTHTVHLVRVSHPDGPAIDTALMTVFRSPHSYTGEDIVEFSCHGGPAIVRCVLDACLAAGARLADPGEFTRRAFINGKMDLSQAEAVAALIESRTESAVRAAHSLLTGALANQVGRMRLSLIELSARLEAEIDFPDDIEAMGHDDLEGPLAALEEQIAALLRTARRGIALRSGARAAIVGKPNVGKSTLMNLLLGRDRVIVSAIPGATRDVVEEEIEIAGVPIRLADTAGLGTAGSELDEAGMDRSLRQIEAADVIIVLFDGSAPLDDHDRRIVSRVRGRSYVAIVNKIDLPRTLDVASLTEALSGGVGCRVWGVGCPVRPARPPTPDTPQSRVQGDDFPRIIEASLARGEGVEELEQAIADRVANGSRGESEGLMICEARHADALRRATEHIAGARQAEDRDEGRDLASDELRAAADALGEITGETTTLAVIDEIFSRFCVGK